MLKLMTHLTANVVWPALYLSERMLAVWPIAAGLLVEFFCVRYITNLRGWRCVWADVSMNLASTLLGIFLIPLSGILWEFLAHFTLGQLINFGTFDPVSWGVTVIISACVNAVLEGWVLRSGFHQTLGRRGFWLLVAANLVSVTMAFVSILLWPPKF